MAIGANAATCYEGEDLQWSFTVSDANITDIAGFDIELVVKATAASANPPLVGPITCSITGTLTFLAEFTAPTTGSYVYSVRRVDPGFSWQFAQAALTVLESASI